MMRTRILVGSVLAGTLALMAPAANGWLAETPDRAERMVSVVDAAEHPPSVSTTQVTGGAQPATTLTPATTPPATTVPTTATPIVVVAHPATVDNGPCRSDPGCGSVTQPNGVPMAERHDTMQAEHHDPDGEGVDHPPAGAASQSAHHGEVHGEDSGEHDR